MRRISKCALILVPYFLICGCSFNLTQDVRPFLNANKLYTSHNTEIKNLGAQSKCSYPASVNLVNDEKKSYPYEVFNNGISFNVDPKELNDMVISYAKDGFEKSGIKVDPNSPKTILISLNHIEGIKNGLSFVFSARVEMNANIPELKQNKIYRDEDSVHMVLMNAMAYAIHVNVRKMIDDAAIQKYILCY